MNMNNGTAAYTAYNNAELIRMVDNSNTATPLEREMATRLDEVSMEVRMLEHELRLLEDAKQAEKRRSA